MTCEGDFCGTPCRWLKRSGILLTQTVNIQPASGQATATQIPPECAALPGTGVDDLQTVLDGRDVTIGNVTVSLPGGAEFGIVASPNDPTFLVCELAAGSYLIINSDRGTLIARNGQSEAMSEIFQSVTLSDGSLPNASTTLPPSGGIAPPSTGDGGLNG